MTIIYSVISTGSNILVHHQAVAGNFDNIMRSMLPNIPTRNDAKTTYTSNNYFFHVVVENGIIYICACDRDEGKRVPYAYLAEIKKQFERQGYLSRAHFALDGEFQDEFSPLMAREMEKFSSGAGTQDGVAMLQNQVDDVKGVMTQNIEKVLQRGEALDDLLSKTDDLEAHSATFKKTARTVHRKMWWKNTKMTLILICVAVVVVLVIILIILFSTGVLPPKHNDGGSTTTAKPVTPS